MNKKQINEIHKEMKERYSDNEDKILILNIVKHTLIKVMKKEKMHFGHLELSENIFSNNYIASYPKDKKEELKVENHRFKGQEIRNYGLSKQ